MPTRHELVKGSGIAAKLRRIIAPKFAKFPGNPRSVVECGEYLSVEFGDLLQKLHARASAVAHKGRS